MSGVCLIFFTIAVTLTNAIPFKTECRQSDIFFLMDSSSSIKTEDFADQLKFVADVVDKLDMKTKNGDIRLGLATFSDSFYLSIDLTDDKDSFLSLIGSVFPLSGSTRIGRALTYLQMEGFNGPKSRKNASKVAIIITDGESVDNPVLIAKELKSQGMKIFVIDAKHSNSKGELRLIASKPSYRFLLNLDGRSVRNAVAHTLSNIGCNTLVIHENCQRMNGQDFRFLIDLAGFGRLKSNRIMEFTIQTIQHLEQKHLNSFFGIHFGFIPNQGVIKIPSVSNLTAVLERFDHLQFPGPQGIITSFLLHPERFKLIEKKKKMIVVFVDESSEPLEELKAATDKFRSKDKYASIFVISMGTIVRKERAKQIASDPSLYLHIPNVSEIEDCYEDFIDLLCNPQDYK